MDYIGSIGTVAFGILSIYFFYKSRSVKKPVFIYQSILLQTKNHPEISIIFRNKIIPNLSRAYILFCNKGNKEIRKDDIPSNQYPLIVFKDSVRVLSVNKASVSSKHNNFEVLLNGNQVEIKFDYMNQNDGVVLEVLYDSDSKEIPAELVAPIIGTSNSILDRYKSESKSGLISTFLGAFLLFLLPATLIVLNNTNKFPSRFSIILFAIILSLLVLFCLIIWKIFRDYYKYSLPSFAQNYFK